MPRHAGPSKYAPLAAYLTALAADVVRLTFPEIEAILGAPLPASARRSAFWVNQPRRWVAARALVHAGWRVARTEVYARPPAVHFARGYQ